ncbi:MAG: carbonic anhydrase [Rhizobacter sp.]|nr:carbonic anhydrase [Rhizobacter sp.]
MLAAGNDRFAADTDVNAMTDARRRLAIARSQAPMAVLVGCSDSRVSPELLFGRGLGELFIVRNAGNTIDNAAQGSIEYAVEELSVPLVVVMGHERCGAVSAAVAMVQKNKSFPASIGHMVEPILPAVLEAKAALDQSGKAYDTETLIEAAVRQNVRREVEELRNSSSIITRPIAEGRLRVTGARYDLDTGKVDFFDH